jgi:hypothetical protein
MSTLTTLAEGGAGSFGPIAFRDFDPRSLFGQPIVREGPPTACELIWCHAFAVVADLESSSMFGWPLNVDIGGTRVISIGDELYNSDFGITDQLASVIGHEVLAERERVV